MAWLVMDTIHHIVAENLLLIPKPSQSGSAGQLSFSRIILVFFLENDEINISKPCSKFNYVFIM